MLTVEIKVNGALAGYIYAVNEGVRRVGQRGNDYRFEAHHPDEFFRRGVVRHDPQAGLFALVERLARAAQEIEEIVVAPEADRVDQLIGHIRDQVNKHQYLNATAWAAELVTELQHRFDEVLKCSAR